MRPDAAAPQWLTLTTTLAALEQSGRRVPCRGVSSDAWTSEDAGTRKDAADACQHCPALALCTAYADAAQETWHVWAARDRTRKTRSPKKETD